MISITKEYRAEIGHRLMDYDGKCAHLHGHSYLFEVTATADNLDDKGMICDFSDLKKAIVTILEPYDHALILREDDPLARSIDVFDGFRATNGDSARLHIWAMNPTAEVMAARFFVLIQELLPTYITITHVRVWETATSHADWSLYHE